MKNNTLTKTLLALASALFLFGCEPVDNPDPGKDPIENPDNPDNPDPDPYPDPDPETLTLAKVIEQGDGAYEVEYARVVAVGKFNIVVSDGTADMLVYDKDQTSGCRVGDEISLSGETTTFNGIPEWYDPEITIKGNATVTYPEPVEIDGAYLAAYESEPEIVYGRAAGTKSGYTIMVDGEKLYSYYNTSVPDGEVTVYGYTIGYAGKYSNTNFVVTSFTEGKDPEPDPDPDPNPDPDPVEPAQGMASWAELPYMLDEDRNGVDDKDKDIYYASHFISDFPGHSGQRNYTVCFSGEHHVAWWVAAPRHKSYEVKGVSRTDAYKQDPKIPGSVQCSSKSTGGGCNKGHMLGSAERLVTRTANEQVFYYSNIAPQLSSGFNTGGGGWNILEDWVDGQVCSDTTYVVIGCYFDTYTDGYGETVSPETISYGGRNDVTRPSMYYYILLRSKSGNTGKPVTSLSSSELKCAAFVRSHTNNHKGQHVTSMDMMTVADLEKITGFTYFVNVPNAPKTSMKASDWGL